MSGAAAAENAWPPELLLREPNEKVIIMNDNGAPLAATKPLLVARPASRALRLDVETRGRPTTLETKGCQLGGLLGLGNHNWPDFVEQMTGKRPRSIKRFIVRRPGLPNRPELDFCPPTEKW